VALKSSANPHTIGIAIWDRRVRAPYHLSFFGKNPAIMGALGEYQRPVMSSIEILLLVVAIALALVLFWFLVVRGAIDLFHGISENFGIPIVARIVYVGCWIFLMPLMLLVSLYLSIQIFFESDEQKRQRRKTRTARQTAP
jgi:hypothetical protein